jgi:hypothetical protein
MLVIALRVGVSASALEWWSGGVVEWWSGPNLGFEFWHQLVTNS